MSKPHPFSFALAMLAATAFLRAEVPAPVVEGAEMSAYIEGVPGGAFAESKEILATVLKIDAEARKITLEDAQGNSFRVKVGKEAVNFDQVKVGDKVSVVSTFEMIVSIGDESSAAADGATATVSAAEKGEKPAMEAVERIHATATVIAVDLEKHSATLRFPDDTVKTFGVRKDVKLDENSVGTQVVFQTVETYSIRVLPETNNERKDP